MEEYTSSDREVSFCTNIPNEHRFRYRGGTILASDNQSILYDRNPS